MESILQQENAVFELLLIDNASTDSTPVILKQLAASDDRIRLLHEPQQGITYALNHGLREAKGAWIARMDADDISLPHRLWQQAQFLEKNPEIELVSGMIEFVGDSEGYTAYVAQLNLWKTEADIRKYRFIESPFAHPSVMFRKSLIDRFGFYSEKPEPEDYELWLRWFAQGVRMGKIEAPVLRWNDSPGRLTRTHASCSPEAIEKVRYTYLSHWLTHHLPPQKPVYVWGGGKLANKKMHHLAMLSGISIAGIIDLKHKANSAIPHIHFSEIPPAGEIFIISLVSNRGKYLEIDQYLQEKGYVYEKDYILAQ